MTANKRQIVVANARPRMQIENRDFVFGVCRIATVAGGWLAFESISEFHAWEDRQPRTPHRVVFDGRGKPIT